MPEKTSLSGRSLIEPLDFSVEELGDLFVRADYMESNKTTVYKTCRGKLMASLFFEASTRTRLSFEAAMLRLGGTCLGFADSSSSSVSKGESFADTIRIIAAYSDVMVLRHPKEGSALVASRSSSVPVINAGDGGHYHPTQTLTDLFTIHRVKKDFSGLVIGFCGDLKFGRTVHSLARALARYKNINLVFIAPTELSIPGYIKDALKKQLITYHETDRLEKVIADLDVLYMTRVQRERFLNEADYIRLKDSYILTEEKMRRASQTMVVLHPLPRVNEIDRAVDQDPRAFYFKQAEYGMYIRMALLCAIL
ncbi:MAG: aspartate carbamoyltransferase [Spirochaetaceae bacterium]|jgi:aspartate carbamoyltransferase catalytic subunit|nr:aspartate carbamoyltransferase [Spirochaetaceae bacterium]